MAETDESHIDRVWEVIAKAGICMMVTRFAGGLRARPLEARLERDTETSWFLTDVRGWLRDPADPESVISEVGADEVETALETIDGGMRPKLAACVDAIHGGVSHAHIVDGRIPHSLLLELFTDAGIGTKVRPAA